MTTAEEDFAASLPRSPDTEGGGLSIIEVYDDGAVLITDGERWAFYVPMEGAPLAGTLTIVPKYVEAGWFSEANCVTLSDGERTKLYVPDQTRKPAASGEATGS